MGLRERKKGAMKLQILESAQDILLKKGYEQTTIEEIAEDADVGTGTIYNYYKSKADLFIAVVMGENERTLLLNTYFPESTIETENPITALNEFIYSAIQDIENISKDLWIEIFKVVFSKINDKDDLKSKLFGFDLKFIDNLKAIFSSFKKKGLIDDDFCEQIAAECIYDIVVAETIQYLMKESINFNEYIKKIQKKIIFIFRENNKL